MSQSLESFRPFLEDLASPSPTPGGGAVAALAGALAAALGHMVGSLTVGKKKYAEVEAPMRGAMGRLHAAIQRFLALADEDARAFDAFMAASRLPKSTPEEAEARRLALEAAALGACEPPLETIEAAAGLLPDLRLAAERGNRHAVSDAGVAALLVTCAAKAAAMNVAINVPALSASGRATVAGRLDRHLEPCLLEVLRRHYRWLCPGARVTSSPSAG
jgi:formiminotetrahydrofolate cyclodeaminase